MKRRKIDPLIRYSLVCGLVLLAQCFDWGLAYAEELVQAAAIVNGEIIPVARLDINTASSVEYFKGSFPKITQIPGWPVRLRANALNQMIGDLLILQEAKRQNMTASLKELKEGIRKVRDRFSTEAEFQQELLKQKTTLDEFTQRIKDQIATQKLLAHEIPEGYTTPPGRAHEERYLATLRARATIENIERDKLKKSFDTAAKLYRSSAVKPAMPEETRKYQIQAEQAVQEKRVDDAIALYMSGLDVARWWPEGHFNLAMLLADQNDFAGAIEEMKNYLVLVPDAPDARAAQDKVYAWEAEVQ